MPQITQLSAIFFSQLFWLAVVFGVIYFVIGRGMVPKVRTTVDAREARIASDLERAQAAREEADRTEADWRTRMNEARAEAAGVMLEAKQSAARDTEVKVKKSVDKLAKKVDAAEAKIRDALASAHGEIETVAAEAAHDMVARLTGLEVAAKDAAAAVKAEING
ncbi:MAG: ATPase [Pseudomonadota bacterium]